MADASSVISFLFFFASRILVFPTTTYLILYHFLFLTVALSLSLSLTFLLCLYCE